MSAARDQLLAAVQRGESWDERRQAQAEDARVRHIFSVFGITAKQRWPLTETQRRRNGSHLLSYALLAEFVPDFPLALTHTTLAGIKLHASSKATLSALFAHFSDVPFVRAYEQCYEAAAHMIGARAIAMTFARQGVVHGLVVHDGTGLEGVGSLVRHAPRLTYQGAAMTIYVDGFAALLQAVHANGYRLRLAV